MLFHTHYFSESTVDPEILYCPCGEIKDLHRHMYKSDESVSIHRNDKIVGEILICTRCGDKKMFVVNK